MKWIWPVAVVLVVLAIAALVVLYLLRRRSAKPGSANARDPRVNVRSTLEAAKKALAEKVPRRADREKLARVLVLGGAGTGKTSLIAASGQRTSLGQIRDQEPLVGVELIGSAVFYEVSAKLLQVREEEDEEQDAFIELLRRLRKAQPERAADLVIVAVPCPALRPEGGLGADDLKRAASNVAKRLAQIERELAILPPVYLVVTGTDALPGFEAFVAELPAHLRDSILGWSSPHGPMATSVADWTAEAISSVRTDLAEVEEQRFLYDAPIRTPEPYYLFESEVGTVERALTTYVDEIFFPSPGSEPFVLRGIYFTGAFGAVPPPLPVPPGAPPPPPAPRPIAFARELFEKKLLPEVGLVRPNARARARRNRTILALQITAGVAMVLGALSLWFESVRLDREAASLEPLLDEVAASLLQAKSVEPDLTGGAETGRVIAFFKGLSGVRTDRLRTFVLPLSLPSSIDDRVEEAVAAAYQTSVLEAYATQLPPRIVPLTEESTGPFRPLSAEGALEKTPEFFRAEEWLRDLAVFELNVARHDRLLSGIEPRGPEMDTRVQDVAGIASYLWGYKIEPSSHAAYYRRAIARPPWRTALLLTPHRAALEARASTLFRALSERQLAMYHEQVIREDLAAIVQGLTDLESGGTDLTPEKLWVLREAIGRAESRLATPTLGWITTEGPPPNAALDKLYEIVRASKLLGPDVEQKLKNLGQSRLLLLKGDLLSATGPICGSVLARKDGVAQPQLSQCILDLKAPLDALRAQPFMTVTATGTLPDDGDEDRLVWDVEVLKEAAAVPKQLETFLQEGGLKSADPRLLETLKGVAARTVRTNVMGRVVKSARREASLPDARAEVGNFAQASVPLRDILSAFGRLRLDDARDRLRRFTRAQGARVLGQSYSELSRAALYAIEGGNFAWWNGEGTPVFRAFGVDDLGQLTEYAGIQRARAETFAKELAEPALSALESPEIGADSKSVPQIAAWRRVVTPVRDYENKKAGNSVAGVERFLLTELPNVTLDNCLAELEKGGRRRESDFFSDRRADVRDKLRVRCLQLSADDIRLRYSSLRRSFNRDIGNRFPFAKLEGNVQIEDAPIDAVRRVLAASTDFRRRYRAALNARGDGSSVSVVRFLDKMEAVRVFLAPFLSPGESSVDGFYDVRAEFRVNQTREVGGHQIAEWGLRIAEERLTQGGPKSTVRWRLDDPVKVQLRWAKNSPDVPTPKQDGRWTVQGRDVRTEEQGTWALLRLIARNQVVMREEEGGDAGGHTLLLSLRTIPDPEGGFLDRVGADATIARVYIRLFLIGTEKDKLLKYPEFPLVAPALTSDFGGEEGEKG